MKKLALVIPCIGVLLAVSCNNPQDETKGNPVKKDSVTSSTTSPAPKMDSAAIAKAMMDYMMPGEMHKLMASLEGNWVSEITMWEKPGAPPSKYSGTSVCTMKLGGRYQVTEDKFDYNGMQSEGIATLGYDNAKKVFVSTWIDNMGTGILHVEGPYDSATKTITLKGKMYDCTTGKDMDFRQTTQIVDANTQLVEMYSGDGGKENKVMAIKLTRK